MPRTGLALGVISSACLPLSSSAAGPHCFQQLSPVLLVRSHSPIVDGAVILLLAWVWVNQALELAKLLVWVSESGRPAPCWVPWSECAHDLVLQMRKVTVRITAWALLVWIWTAKLHVLVVASHCLLLSHSYTLSGWVLQIPLQSLWCKIRMVALAQCWFSPEFFFSHWKNYRLRGDLSTWCCTGLGEGKCSQQVVASLYPCDAVCLGLWGAGGCFSLTLLV